MKNLNREIYGSVFIATYWTYNQMGLLAYEIFCNEHLNFEYTIKETVSLPLIHLRDDIKNVFQSVARFSKYKRDY